MSSCDHHFLLFAHLLSSIFSDISSYISKSSLSFTLTLISSNVLHPIYAHIRRNPYPCLLKHTTSCHTTLHYTTLNHIIPHHITLHCTIVYHTIYNTHLILHYHTTQHTIKLQIKQKKLFPLLL